MPSRDFSQMRHRYYIVRPEPNKTCVPMVALDELPIGLRLKGVPMTVTPQQILDWDMARVGADVKLTDSFEVDFDRATVPRHSSQSAVDEKTRSRAEQTRLSKEVSSGLGTANEEDQTEKVSQNIGSVNPDKSGGFDAQNANSAERGARSISGLQQQANVGQATPCFDYNGIDITCYLQEAANDFVEQSKWEKENDCSKTQDAATPGVYGKKKFCTHWIRTGNCDYMQEGCRYLHVIPDAETRLKIGIRDMPRWAREDLPSPPRDIHRARQRSWSPPREKRDPHKDWRYRGNHKTHAELETGPVFFSGPAPARSSTPTRQTHIHGKSHGPQRRTFEMQTTQPVGSTHKNLSAAHFATLSHHDNATSPPVPQNPSSVCNDTAASQPIPMASAVTQLTSDQVTQQGFNAQGPFTRQQQVTPLLSNSTSLPMQSSQIFSGLHGGPSRLTSGGRSYGLSYPDGNYGAPRLQQSPIVRPLDAGNGRMDGGRWGYSSPQPHVTPAHQLMQSRVTPTPSSPMASPWLRGHVSSPTPSFSKASFGTIGYGRPNYPDHGLSSPMTGSPILHKRLFRQPGESQYVQAHPESKAKPRNGNGHNSHTGKSTTTLAGQEGDGGCSEELGNLIALDE